MSAAYKGDPQVKGNRSADIPEEENVALFLQHLPATWSYPELLGAIWGVGKIQSCHITPPDGTHITSCAKLAMYTRDAAEKLFRQLLRGKISIHRYRPHPGLKVAMTTLPSPATSP